MNPKEVRPRRWWIAAPLALINPVLAYLYLGRLRRALAALFATILLGLAFYRLLHGQVAEPRLGLAIVGGIFVFTLIVMLDVVAIALQSKSYQLHAWNRWWIYLAVLAFVLAGSWLESFAFGVHEPIRTYSIESSAMLPTLLLNERIFAYPSYYDNHEPERGDVITFYTQKYHKATFIRRIVGLPGDEVEIRKGILYLNGSASPISDRGAYSFARAGSNTIEELTIAQETLPNDQRVLILRSKPGCPGDEISAMRVPAGTYFLLGDNRDNSLDSRSPDFGFVPRANILGHVAWIYWSSDLNRIGQIVQ